MNRLHKTVMYKPAYTCMHAHGLLLTKLTSEIAQQNRVQLYDCYGYIHDREETNTHTCVCREKAYHWYMWLRRTIKENIF